MKDIEKAYIAGIIDGEGSIMLQRFHSGEYPSPCISIASTTLELLNWIKDIIGKGTIINKKNYNLIEIKENENVKNIWCLSKMEYNKQFCCDKENSLQRIDVDLKPRLSKFLKKMTLV